jgi:apolipoprotein D and lipocalin family protein
MKRFTSRVIGILLIGAAALVSVGCTAVPEGVEPVSDFSLDRYLGTWFEIARLDHRFERGLSEVTATYSRRDDGGVRVQNRGFNDETGDWEDIEGKAYFIGSADRGSLKVSFFGPIYGGYHVIALDDAYQHALVSGPDRSYLWILSRTPEMDPQVLTKLTEQARVLDFPVDELIFVPHGVEDR